MWQSIGLLTVYPDKWVSSVAITESNLIRITWFKGDVPLYKINKRFLIRRKFITGEVDKGKIIYASDEPLIIEYDNTNNLGAFYIQLKKLMLYSRYPRLINEPFYQLLIESFETQP